jgi:integrase
MTEQFNFTKQAIDDLKPSEKRYSVKDTQVKGLRVMVYPTGVKTFILCRKIKRSSERIKIGRCDDITIMMARKQAEKLNAFIALGGNPSQERSEERKEINFKELYEHYYNQYAVPHTKRPDQNRKMIDYHIIPAIGRLKLREVTPERIRKLHAHMGKHSGHGGANRVVNLVSAVFNFGIKNGYHKMANPCYGLTKFRETSRDRFLSRTELKSFFESLSFEDQLYQDYFSILLFTGARKSNVLAMRWKDLDFDLKRWRIPESETKNGEVNTVGLSDKSIEILTRRKQSQDELNIQSPYVFPSTGASGYLNDPKKAFDRIKKRIGVKDIRMHDLRRTLASYMAISGVSLPIIGRALNHKSQVSTAIYARLDMEPVLSAVNIATSAMLG